MASIEVTLTIKVDGMPLPGMPIQKRLEVDEHTGRVEFEQATGGGYAALPGTSALSEVQFLFLRANKAVTLRLDGQSDAGIPLNAHGLILIMDADIDVGASTNATLDNGSGATALVQALAAGT